MKKNFFFSIATLLCAIFMVACGGGGKNGGGSGADKTAYLQVLPSDAFAIIKVDLGNLLDKSQVLENIIVNTAFEQGIKDAPKEIKTLLKSIYKNPNNSGVNVKAPVYVALTGVEPTEAVIAIAMDNVKTFEKTLSTISNGEFRSFERNGMKYVSVGEDEVEVAYDNNMIVIACSEYRADVSDYTSLASDERAVNDKNFAAVFNGDDDAKLVVNLQLLFNEMLRHGVVEPELKPVLAMLKDVDLYASLNFEKGFVDFKVNANLPAEYGNVIDEFLNEPAKNHFKYIPGNAFAVMNYNFDMLQLYPILESAGVLRELRANGLDGEDVKKILKSISGDYTAAIWVNGNDAEDIQFMAAFDCKDRTLFDLLAAYLSYEIDATLLENDVYALNVNREEVFNYYTGENECVRNGYDYYLMYKDGAIMLMPQNLYDKITRDGNFSSLRNSAMDNTIYSSMTDDIVVDIKPLRDILANNIRNAYRTDNDDKMALEVMDMIKSLTVDFNICDLDVKLNLIDKNTNSLKLIVDKVISIGMQYNLFSDDDDDEYYDDYGYDNYGVDYCY